MPTPELSIEPVTVGQNGRLLRVGALVHNDPGDPCHWRVNAVDRDFDGYGKLIVSPASPAAEAWVKAPYNQPWYGILYANSVIEVGTELMMIQ